MRITNINYTDKESWGKHTEELWVVLERGNGLELYHYLNGTSVFNQSRLLFKNGIVTKYHAIYTNEEEARKDYPELAKKQSRDYSNGRWRMSEGNVVNVDIDGDVAFKYKDIGFTKKQFDEYVSNLVKRDYEKTIGLREKEKQLLEELAKVQNELRGSEI